MHARSRSLRKTPSLQHYVRVDDEVEILVDKPVPIKMENDQCPYFDSETLLSHGKKTVTKKGKLGVIEYADDCPEKSFKTPQAFYTPAQLVPKRYGNKNKSEIDKLNAGFKMPSNLNPIEQMNGAKDKIDCDTLKLCIPSTNINCSDKGTHLKNECPSPSGSSRKNLKAFPSQSLASSTMLVSSNKGLHPKLYKNGSLNNVNSIEAHNHNTFYNHVVNEADTPPFTPNLDMNCCKDSSSCSMPDIVHVKTEPGIGSTKAILTKSNTRRFPPTTNPRSKFKRNSIMSPLAKKATKSTHREMSALYKNLQEISWAQDKSFKSRLKSQEAPCHAVRTAAERASVAIKAKSSPKVEKTVTRSPANNRVKVHINPPKLIKKSVPKSLGKKASPTFPVKKTKASTNPLSAFVKKKLQNSAKFALRKTSGNKTAAKKPRAVIRYKLNPAVIKAMPPPLPKPDAKKKNSSFDDCEIIATIPPKTIKTLGNSSLKKEVVTSSAIDKSGKKVEKNPWSSVLKNPDERIMAILQNKQELRVTLEPLENTSLYTRNCNFLEKVPNVIEAFTRKSLQQSMLRVFTDIDQKHISSVLKDSPESKSASNGNAKASRKRKYDEESVRSSVRQSECAFRYKEIVVRKHESYIQIVLVPNTYKQNCLTIEAMKELKEAFLSAKKDLNCKAVLINSSGTYFCSGIDLSQLHGSNKKHVAEEMAITIRDLILTLALFPKPVVAAVNGTAIGLGVTLLTFCDVVLCSDKATFCIPSTRFGYIPEGGALLTLPQVVGSTVAMEMLLQGRCLTAEQALKYGLVSEVLWPTQLMEEVVPRILLLVRQPLHVMEATKTMVRCHLWEKLAVQLNEEWHILVSQWLSQFCQQNIKVHMQTGWQLD